MAHDFGVMSSGTNKLRTWNKLKQQKDAWDEGSTISIS